MDLISHGPTIAFPNVCAPGRNRLFDDLVRERNIGKLALIGSRSLYQRVYVVNLLRFFK
ncbi:hypothetical protein [Rhizobium sp. BK377]|uniref:hypothetical protein n=1 Tax=Rhizobium sp. BK377 TaxID=2587058 RepID=UPI00161122D9|nr:hypothetical protein [Rhizobium sp. BK377]MBB3461460.1 hypothetical protein [Rhizobium sp. BK377]